MRVAWLSVLGLAVMFGAPALAQSVVPVPAELPPADFAAREYVDSLGCAFQRAGVSGTLVWVPRLGADRKPVCGKPPSFAALIETPKIDPAGTDAAPAVATKAATAKPAVAKVKTSALPVRRAATTLVESRTIAKADTRCPSRIGTAQRYLVSDGRRVTKCGPAVADGVGFVNGLGVPDLQIAGVDASPGAVAAARAASQTGYRLTWTNGALRPARKEALPAAALALKWVQVGAFAQAANADRAMAKLKTLGLPVAHVALTVGGKGLKAVLAGPFETPDDLAAALDQLRRAGFPDAFPRR